MKTTAIKHLLPAIAIAWLSFTNLQAQQQLSSLSPIEQELFTQTNAAREKEGLPALKFGAAICDEARKHSKRMADGTIPFGHDGSKERRRAAAASQMIPYSGGSENASMIQMNGDAKTLATKIIQGWLDSPGHRKNMLSNHQEYLGVGVVENAKGEKYATQIFLKLSQDRRPH